MASLTIVLATLGLLCTSTLAAEMKTFVKEYHEESADFMAVPRNIAMADQSFAYLTCERLQAPHERQCQVTMEMPDKPHKRCNFKLVEPETREILLNNQTKLKTFAGNKALIELFSRDRVNGYEHQYRKIVLVDFDTCQDRHLDFPLDRVDWPNYQVVVYHDSFDVYVTSKALCGEAHGNQCILRYNKEGERIGELVGFPSKYANVYSTVVDPYAPKSGAFFAAVDWHKNGSGLMHATHVSHEGSETVLYSYPITDRGILKHIVGSNEHKYWTSCHLEEPEGEVAHCLQYDLEGRKMLMDANVELGKGHKMLNVFGRQGGGVLFVCRGCSGSPDCTTAHVKLVAADGSVDGHLELIGVEYRCASPSKKLSVDHLETEIQHCFYFACAHHEEDSAAGVNFKYFNKCVDKKT